MDDTIADADTDTDTEMDIVPDTHEGSNGTSGISGVSNGVEEVEDKEEEGDGMMEDGIDAGPSNDGKRVKVGLVIQMGDTYTSVQELICSGV